MAAATAGEKPLITIDLSVDPASDLLSILKVDPASTHQKLYDLRPPLGIYNLSCAQLAQRLSRCCSTLEDLLLRHRTPSSFASDPESQTLSDYLLLTMYASAEHVDDLESVLLTFFETRKEFARSPVVRQFKKDLSLIRRRMCAYANAVKHQQARIRTYLLGARQSGHEIVFPGFYIEGVHNEVVGPSKIFHSQEKIISYPSFLWETLIFVYQCAALLEGSVAKLRGTKRPAKKDWPDLLGTPTRILARLPNFSFDGRHPFQRTSVRLERVSSDLASDASLYGSLFDPWAETDELNFREVIGSFVGDGVTRQFQLADPQNLNLQRWQ